MKSKQLLDSFVTYCEKHPAERFWQALRNWSTHNFILVANSPEAKSSKLVEDTFYWNSIDGQN